MHIDPPIDDPDVFQYFVGGHTGQIVERQASFSAAVSALLDEQIRLPVFCLRTDLRFENTGHRCIGMILSRRAILCLSHTNEILCGRIGGAHPIDPVWFRLSSKPGTAGERDQRHQHYSDPAHEQRSVYHGITR